MAWLINSQQSLKLQLFLLQQQYFEYCTYVSFNLINEGETTSNKRIHQYFLGPGRNTFLISIRGVIFITRIEHVKSCKTLFKRRIYNFQPHKSRKQAGKNANKTFSI